MIVEELQLQSAANQQLAAWLHSPEQNPKGVVVLVHGLGEHTGRYLTLAKRFTEAGYALLVYDQRGHGLTPGKRGHARYSDLLEDVGVMLSLAEEKHAGVPIYLYGHSMGGNIALNFLLRSVAAQTRIKGLILSSPWISLAFKAQPFLVAGARLMATVRPEFLHTNRLELWWLSHNPEIGKAYAADPLVHSCISVGLFCQTHEAGSWALRHIDQLRVPLLVMHGTEDMMTCARTSKKLATRAGNLATFREWKGLRHELHNEYQAPAVLQQALSWMHSL